MKRVMNRRKFNKLLKRKCLSSLNKEKSNFQFKILRSKR
jgi:hypothetical protein